MKCDNRFCIYQEVDNCTCEEEIEIDWRGMCKNMIPARITSDCLDDCKGYTKMILKNNEYFFDDKIGIVTMTKGTRQSHNNE